MSIRRVTITGCTHGNERTGWYLLRHWAQSNKVARYPALDIELLLANPKAHAKGLRYIDTDLNRCFCKRELADATLHGYEHNRAKALAGLIGPDGSRPTDCILDIHTATSNLGSTIILVDANPFNVAMAAWVSMRVPELRIYTIPTGTYADATDQPFITALAPRGYALEMGPVPQGQILHDINVRSEEILQHTLAYLTLLAEGKAPTLPQSLTVYEHQEMVLYPCGVDGEMDAVIHRDFQGQDYVELHPDDPIFSTIAGETISYQGVAGRYPVFINEAAYYDRRIAFSLTEKKVLPVEISGVKA